MSTSNTRSMTNFESVGQFNLIFGHPKHDTLQENVLEDTKLIQLRLNLISEEISELCESVRTRDMIETIDALGDILYVIYGMGQVTGINLDKEFHEQYKHLLPNSNERTNFEIVKEIMQDFTSMPQRIDSNIFENDPRRVDDCCETIYGEFENLKAASREDLTRVKLSLINLLFGVYKMGYCLGIDLNVAFRIVHESNMSKLCRNEEEAKDSIKHYSTLSGFESTPVGYRRSTEDPDYFVIYNIETGKILKSKYFRTPDFSSMFETRTVKNSAIEVL